MSSNSTGTVAAQGTTAAKRSIGDVAGKRMQISLWLAFALIAVYFGFTLLVAFAPNFLAKQVADSMTLAIVLAVVVIVVAWFITLFYMRWANRYHDAACDKFDKEGAK